MSDEPTRDPGSKTVGASTTAGSAGVGVLIGQALFPDNPEMVAAVAATAAAIANAAESAIRDYLHARQKAA